MFKSMKLTSKLSLGFALLTLIGTVIGIFGMIEIKQIADADAKQYTHMTVPLGQVGDIINYFQRLRVTVRDAVYAETETDKRKFIDRFNEISAKFNEVGDAYEKTLIFDAGRQAYGAMKASKQKYVQEAQKIFDALWMNDRAAAVGIMKGTAYQANNEMQKHVDEMQASKIGFAKQTAEENENLAELSFIIMTTLILFAVIASVLLAFFIIKGVGKQLGADPMIVQDLAIKLSEGDFSTVINLKPGDDASLLYSMEQMSLSVNAMVAEVNTLAQAGINGKLDTRANADKYKGEYRTVVAGVNATLDAVIGPLNVAAEYVDRISKGDIPNPITDNYNGDFNSIKMNLNQCISAVQLLITDSDRVYQAVKVGDLQLRPDRNMHQGDFRKVIDGITNTLDTIGIALVENIRVMNEMAKGNLSVRYDGKFLGAFAALQDTVNQTLTRLPLTETVEIMQELAIGNLTKKMTGEYQGDSLNLKNAVNGTIDSLNEILGNVRTTVDEVTRAAMQVSDTSTSLSQGATEQAASLEEITSSMSQIGSQTRLNAENSNSANTLANDARTAAERGNAEMGQLTDAMTEINESSKNISKIIKVIDEIAFQTNLLALNAAVEAARAGRHGKGFAVVAEEVRNLAARSATAAKETSEMIEHSIKTVERGTDLVTKTGDALSDIQNSSVKVANIIGEITASSNEQAQGITQINEGLTQIDTVTQTNTASAEQSASAAEELSGQSNQLRELVDRFKLTGRGVQARNTSAKYAAPKQMRRNTNSRALSAGDFTPVREEDLYMMVDDSIRSNAISHKAKDIIKLDEDDFDRY